MSLMRIDDLFHFEKGILQSSKCTEGEFDFITASSEWKTHNEYTHDCEALVFAAAASGSLGRTHYVNGKFVSSDLCFIITAKDPKKLPIDLKFYHMVFNEFKNDIVNSTKAGTSKEAIGMKAFGNYKLPYFAINKQIETKVQFVNMQDSKVELYEELTHQLSLIKQMRQAFLREAMQGKLVKSTNINETGQQLLTKIKAEKAQLIAEKKLKKEKELAFISEDEIPFEIPEHWAWFRLGDVTLDISYGTSQKADDNNEIPVLRMGNITTDGRILYSNLKYVSSKIKDLPKLYLNNKDLIFNRTNSYELVGKCGVFNNDKTYTLASYLIRVRLFEDIHSNFVSNYINSSFCRKTQIEPQIIQQNGQANFNGTKLSGIIIPLPPLHEQEQIVAKVEELMAFCDGLEQSIKQSQGYNEKLLQQVLREALQGEEKVF